MQTLFIFPKRGLFHITLCGDCRHIFKSPESDSNLMVIKQFGKLMMLDKYSQNPYDYPEKCPNCGGKNIISKWGGVQELTEVLEKNLNITVEKLYKENTKDDKKTEEKTGKNLEKINLAKFKKYDGKISISTRLFDPEIDYKKFDQVILLNTENIASGIDYLVNEEVFTALFKLFLNLQEGAKIIFDTQSLRGQFIEKFLKFSREEMTLPQIYLQFLQEEKKSREKYKFPPFVNLVLFTSQEDTPKLAKKKIDGAFLYLKNILQNDFEADFQSQNLTITPPYQTKILKRKNKYSYNFLIKYPRNFQHFAKLRTAVSQTSQQFSLQIRLNPKHIF